MQVKDPSPVHAQKRSKNFTLLAVLAAWIIVMFIVTMIKIATGH